MSDKTNVVISGVLDYLTAGESATLAALNRAYDKWREANGPNTSCWLVLGYQPDPLTAAWAAAKRIEVKIVGWCPRGQAFLLSPAAAAAL